MTELTPPVFIARKSVDDGNTIIDNFHFFPPLNLLDFQQRYNVDAGTEENRQIQALTTAMQSVNDELLASSAQDSGVSWVAEKMALGYCTLEAVPSLRYGQCTEKVMQYSTAVYAHAKARLVERHRDTDSKRSGYRSQDMERTEYLENTANAYFQESRESIRALMDKPRCTIELL